MENENRSPAQYPTATRRLVIDQDAKRLAGKSKWLFPQIRERRRGAGMDGHVSEKVIKDALEGIGLRFGPHNFRRAFAKRLMNFSKKKSRSWSGT